VIRARREGTPSARRLGWLWLSTSDITYCYAGIVPSASLGLSKLDAMRKPSPPVVVAWATGIAGVLIGAVGFYLLWTSLMWQAPRSLATDWFLWGSALSALGLVMIIVSGVVACRARSAVRSAKRVA